MSRSDNNRETYGHKVKVSATKGFGSAYDFADVLSTTFVRGKRLGDSHQLRAIEIAEETYGDKMSVVYRGPSDFPAHVNACVLEQPRISYSKVNIYGHEPPSRLPLGLHTPGGITVRNLRK
jgi:hypothetical protein